MLFSICEPKCYMKLTYTAVAIMVFVWTILQTVKATAQDSLFSPRTRLPADFVGNRVFLRADLKSGQTLSFWTDTGGGTWIDASLIDSLQLPVTTETQNGETNRYVNLGEIVRSPVCRKLFNGRRSRLFAYTINELRSVGEQSSGLFGSYYLSQFSWTYDYPRRRMYVNTPVSQTDPHAVPLYFQRDSSGQKTTFFPRFEVVIAGDTLDMLFDTGATLYLTANAQAALKSTRRAMGVSFIKSSLFRQWRVIEAADQMGANQQKRAAMIEVPQMMIGGHSVGPVWFVERPDSSYDTYMRQYVDAPICGAVGGSAFQYLIVSFDYRHERARFERPNR